jgi:hypothetical protein
VSQDPSAEPSSIWRAITIFGVLTLLVVIGVAVASLIGGDDEPEPRRTPRVVDEPDPEPPKGFPDGYIVALDGRDVVLIHVITKEREVVGRVRRGVVPHFTALSPNGRRLAYATGRVLDDGSFAQDEPPVLHLLDLRTGESTRVGPGARPVWDRDGRRVAYIVPSEDRGAEMVQTAVVDVARPADSDTVTSPGEWATIGWTDDRVVLFDGKRAALVAPGRDVEVVAEDVNGVWGVSPNERWVVALTEGGFVVIDRDAGRRRRLRPRQEVAAGAWHPRDRVGVAPVFRTGAGGTLDPELAVLDPVRARLRPLPGTMGAFQFYGFDRRGNLLAFERRLGGGRGEVVACRFDRRCVSVMPLTQDLVPVGIAPR